MGSPSFHSTRDPVDNPGPAHCIECAATISTVMPVNNAYSWNPLRWLLTVCGGGLEPEPGRPSVPPVGRECDPGGSEASLPARSSRPGSGGRTHRTAQTRPPVGPPAGAVIRQGQARRASPWGPAYPARVDQRSPWEARPATRGSLTASTALCGASCSFSPPSSIHGLQKTADLRGGEHKTRREDANLDPGDLTAAEPGQGGCGAGRSEGRSREGAGGRDGAG